MSRAPKDRDAEVQRVAAEIDSLLDDLRASVDALTAVLVPPDTGGAAAERLVQQ